MGGNSSGVQRSLCLAILLAVASPCFAQQNSNTAGVNLNLVVNPFIAVAVSPATVNFLIPPNGSDIGDSPITIQTAWRLRPSVGNLTLYAYFSSSAAALTDGAGNNIPSAQVSGSVNGGAFTPFTANSPYAAGSALQIFRFPIRGFNRAGQRTDTLDLQISVTGLGLPSGTYSGVLFIQAQAI